MNAIMDSVTKHLEKNYSQHKQEMEEFKSRESTREIEGASQSRKDSFPRNSPKDTYCGYLDKLHKKGWKRRYFILRDGILSRYESEVITFRVG